MMYLRSLMKTQHRDGDVGVAPGVDLDVLLAEARAREGADEEEGEDED